MPGSERPSDHAFVERAPVGFAEDRVAVSRERAVEHIKNRPGNDAQHAPPPPRGAEISQHAERAGAADEDPAALADEIARVFTRRIAAAGSADSVRRARLDEDEAVDAVGVEAGGAEELASGFGPEGGEAEEAGRAFVVDEEPDRSGAERAIAVEDEDRMRAGSRHGLSIGSFLSFLLKLSNFFEI